jgi:hypothetical protein
VKLRVRILNSLVFSFSTTARAIPCARQPMCARHQNSISYSHALKASLFSLESIVERATTGGLSHQIKVRLRSTAAAMEALPYARSASLQIKGWSDECGAIKICCLSRRPRLGRTGQVMDINPIAVFVASGDSARLGLRADNCWRPVDFAKKQGRSIWE